ncbi:MAG: hypothetical protein CVU97_04460 [Firmicutes bacterium HGW-Firmicutes-21]|nr:MAG: hypothetical protein CVU97_04460 [Firmicutes bacterium HGW-Firmicutes-21]
MKKYRKQYLIIVVSLFLVACILCSCEIARRDIISSSDEPPVLSVDISTDEQSDEAVDDTLKITDISDYEELGLTSDDGRYLFIKAFIEGDTSALEDICGLISGTYDGYKAISIGDYSVFVKDYDVFFSFEITSSELDTLPVGKYTYIVEMDIAIYMRPIKREMPILTPTQTELMKYFTCGYYYEIVDYTTIDSSDKDRYLFGITGYILVTYDNITLEQMQDFALKIFGITDFYPGSNALLIDGVYTIAGYGGSLLGYEFLDETTEKDLTTITIQFYADLGKTIKSHIIEYKMTKNEDIWVFLSSDIIYKAKYKPYLICV